MGDAGRWFAVCGCGIALNHRQTAKRAAPAAGNRESAMRRILARQGNAVNVMQAAPPPPPPDAE